MSFHLFSGSAVIEFQSSSTCFLAKYERKCTAFFHVPKLPYHKLLLFTVFVWIEMTSLAVAGGYCLRMFSDKQLVDNVGISFGYFCCWPDS